MLAYILTFFTSLRDGRSIRTVSALLLQLVQTSAHNVRIEARRIAKARRQQFALRRQESMNGDIESDDKFLDECDSEVRQIYVISTVTEDGVVGNSYVRYRARCTQ